MPAISSAATFPLPLPQSPPRLVATDLDGTLLRADGTISARTREALAAAEEAGVEVVFVVGTERV